MKHDEFGDRMKMLEGRYTNARVFPNDFLAVRLDGKNFSKYTAQFTKPFDQRLTDAMVDTMTFLVQETHANVGYVQSDEITLIYSVGEKAKEHIFGGKTTKINSILASMAAAKFNSVIESDKLAFFDCRAWAVPTAIEASNVLLWRVQDCRKNAVSAMFRWTVGAKRMHGLNQLEMQTILNEEHYGIWDALSYQYKFGTCATREVYQVELDYDTLQKIPEDKRPVDNIINRSRMYTRHIGDYNSLPLEDRVALVDR